MIPAAFEYVRPSSLDEAVQALADGVEDAKVIAGGQRLLPLLRLRLAYRDMLVDVGGLVICGASGTRGTPCGSARGPRTPRSSATR
jgi:carbon-monoxide dehydrogenase medium subunit